jgi:two-component system, chemotaxis family, chemotaxis protein CheV
MDEINQNKILLESGTNELEVITFELRWYDQSTGDINQTVCGINAAKVTELIAMPEEIIEVPESPDCVLGMFLLRDRTIPLIDLCLWFDYQQEEVDKTDLWVVIVAEINKKPFGFVTHGVDKVYRVSWNQMHTPPDMIASCESLTSLCMVENIMIQMVDFERIAAAIDPSMVLKSNREHSAEQRVKGQLKKSVFIADDSRVILKQVKLTLENAKFNVVAHTDGQACWERLLSLKEQGLVDEKVLAVITDIEMPRMDGHHLCMRIKEDAAFKKLPVILFSSMINAVLRRKGDSVGADDQITKPELDQLIDRLRSVVSEYQEKYS